MTSHDTVHTLKFMAWQLVEAKKYANNYYAQNHIDKALEHCEILIGKLGQELISTTEERV